MKNYKKVEYLSRLIDRLGDGDTYTDACDEVMEVIGQYIKLLEQPGSGWLPIESTPKNKLNTALELSVKITPLLREKDYLKAARNAEEIGTLIASYLDGANLFAADGWRDIETCEYDNERRILISDGGSVDCVWMETDGHFYHYPGNQLGYYKFSRYDPIKWQPLPPPPQSKDCEQQPQPQPGGCEGLLSSIKDMINPVEELNREHHKDNYEHWRDECMFRDDLLSEIYRLIDQHTTTTEEAG